MSEEIAKLPQNEAQQLFRLPNSYYERGFKKGIEEGLEKGIEEGEKKKAAEFARKLLQREFSIGEVIDMTGLTAQEVEKIRGYL